ncbi:MAG: glycosyltransferase family 9 protein [Nitrospirales bacterium]|nr:glycosyltransferase family 9 protein [Nitrospirales bacterium]
MSKQVVIINITRMGDLFQMTPLLFRLEEEWPGVAIDLIVDKEFAGVASLLPGIRQVLAYDFQQLLDESRAKTRDVVSLYREVASWANPLCRVGYDRVINLTFNRRSAFLTSFLGCPDVRGIMTTSGGDFFVRNSWMSYFLDFQQHRHLNRFNIVDLYALGGSRPGTFHPLRLQLPSNLSGWAEGFLKKWGSPRFWIGIQIGASDPMKAWHPASYGRMMAMLGAHVPAGFVLIGTKKEEPAIQEALLSYRQAGGQAPICEAFGKTTVGELLVILNHCHLMVSNDTGPMHMAVGVQTPVVNISVGHVDFRETGPYGPGHWVIQPDISCGPCGFDMVCPHHACKDHIDAQYVADLCRHVLAHGPFPKFSSRMRVYEGSVDKDQSGSFVLRAGAENRQVSWYAQFWKKFWFETFTGRTSEEQLESPTPPDWLTVNESWRAWIDKISSLCQQADQVEVMCRQRPISVVRLQWAQSKLKEHTSEFLAQARQSLAISPLATAFFRDSHNLQASSLEGMAKEHAQAFHLLSVRLRDVANRLQVTMEYQERGHSYASTARS